jgi:glucosylceramidase
VRIGSNNTGSLATVAFKNPEGKKVLIVLNKGTNTESFNIKFGGSMVTSALKGGAVATYVW